MSQSTNVSIESTLWQAMDLLRGHVAAYQSAGYLYRLLLLKLFSDMVEDTPPSQQLPFTVPENARWSSLCAASRGLGTMLDDACRSLERTNTFLQGVLTRIEFDSIMLGDPLQRDQRLLTLFTCLSSLPRFSGSLVSSGNLGASCETLLRKAAEVEGKKGGESLTPPSVVRLLIGLLAPEPGMRICDPTCGVGHCLAACARSIFPPSERSSLVLHGQEMNLDTWALCRMNLMLHGLFDVRIEPGDVLRTPGLFEEGRLLRYDRVVADPPFGLMSWGAEEANRDPFHRFAPIPPKNVADYAFIQHCLAILAQGGMAAVLSSPGVLFRSGSEESIRRMLLEEDLIEAIIGLPGNLRYETTLPIAAVILRRGKPAGRRDRVLFIDASQHGAVEGRQRFLLDENIDAILSTFHAFRGDAAFARVVPLDEIQRNAWNLNIALYLRKESTREPLDLDAQLEAVISAERQRDDAARRVDAMVDKLRRSHLPRC